MTTVSTVSPVQSESNWSRVVSAHFQQVCATGGRLAGTDSEGAALDYAMQVLRRLDAGSLHTHQVNYNGWHNQQIGLEIDGARFEAIALPCGAGLDGGSRQLEIVDAGRGTPAQLQQLGAAIPGRAVLVTHEYMFDPSHVHRIKKVQAAVELGAQAVIVACPWQENGVVSGGIEPTVAGFGVSWDTAEVLRGVARSGSTATFAQVNQSGPMQTQTIDWLYSPPSATHELIVCAHIDGHAVAQSALDNASGVAVALTIACQAVAGGKSALTLPEGMALRVLLFSAEEFGLCGSEQYVAQLSASHRERITAVVNLDCVGGSMVLGATTSGFDSMVRLVSTASATVGIPVRIHNELIRNSDHYNFAAAGIPALRLIAGFGQADSKLRHVLTGFDREGLVTGQELDNALTMTQALVSHAGY